MLRYQGELVRPAAPADRVAAARQVSAGHLRQIIRGLFTTNVSDHIDEVVRRNLYQILGMYYPGAVVVDRSAREGGIADGFLYVTHSRERELRLPGVVIEPRPGAGGLDGDMPMPGDTFLASIPRSLVENAAAARPRRSTRPRTLTRPELEAWIEDLFEKYGEERVLAWRKEADTLGATLGAIPQAAIVGSLIGAALGTRPKSLLRTSTLRSRAEKLPYDTRRLELFEELALALPRMQAVDRPVDPVDPRWTFLPFFEAYFSNFIEGTEFTVAEAASIALENKIPKRRPQDAHDILGTYRLVADRSEMARLPNRPTDLLQLLRRRHGILLAGRPDKAPGEFKDQANRAGATEFVAPDLVEGTLTRAYDVYEGLGEPFSRALFMMFVVAEVHPFLDGNGRIARVMMNAELVAADQQRIIIPTVYRNEYLGALRAMTHNHRAEALYSVLAFGQQYVHEIEFTSVNAAEEMLTATRAFEPPGETVKLILPSAAEPALGLIRNRGVRGPRDAHERGL